MTATAQPVSLIEIGAAKVAAISAARRSRAASRPDRGPGALSAVGEALGTVAALACFVVAAFALGWVIGFAVTGVALLLLDFKATVIRRARAARRQQRR